MMWRASQGIHDFLRAYFHFKSADWKQNQPFKLAGFTASYIKSALVEHPMPAHAASSGARQHKMTPQASA